jgi:hypothetical protein
MMIVSTWINVCLHGYYMQCNAETTASKVEYNNITQYDCVSKRVGLVSLQHLG